MALISLVSLLSSLLRSLHFGSGPLEAAASPVAGPWGSRTFWSCVQSASSESLPSGWCFPVLRPEGVGPLSSPHLWLPLFGGPRHRVRERGRAKGVAGVEGDFPTSFAVARTKILQAQSWALLGSHSDNLALGRFLGCIFSSVTGGSWGQYLQGAYEL